MRERLESITDNYLSVQQDILQSFVDRGQLQYLARPTLNLDHPRQLALMHVLVRFANIAAANTFTTSDLHAPTAQALGCALSRVSSLFVALDLLKLRAKGLVDKIPSSHCYRLRSEGYRICVLFLKLFERIYAPLTAGLFEPFRADASASMLASSPVLTSSCKLSVSALN